METRQWRHRMAHWAYAVGLFAFMMLFFAKIHPLMMHDGDDWGYTAYTRWATPIWGYWNPTKIFPETMMPISAYLAAHVVMPFVGDFTWSLTYVHAFAVSLCITAYVLLLGRLLRRKFGTPLWAALLLCALFTMLHFLAFRSQRTDNVHLFYCWNVNTYYNYLMPSLLNACLVMMFERRSGFIRNPIGQGFVFLMIYMAIMSNLLSSYILAIYCGMLLLQKIWGQIKRQQPIRIFLRENGWIMGILALWMLSLIFELNGARATSLSTDEPFLNRLATSIRYLARRLFTLNSWFFGVCIVCVLAGFVVLVRSRLSAQRDRYYMEMCLRLMACALISTLYVMLVSAKSAPDYSNRPDVIFGIAFFCLLVVMASAAYVIGRYLRAAAVLPLLLVILFFETDTRWTTFKESNISNLSTKECAQINNAMIEQIVLADKAGLDEVYVHVPEGPYPYYMADGIARTMLKCGLIERAIPNAYIVVDDQFYEKYEIWGHDSAAREAVEALKPTEETP